MLYTEIGIGCLVFILINVPNDGDNLIHLLAVIGILNWGLELYLRIFAVKGDSLLALENKPMLIKKAKKDFYSVIPILVIFELIIIFNTVWNTDIYVLEKSGDSYQFFRIPGHPDDYRLMEHNCVTVSIKALVDGSGEHPTLNRLRGAVIPGAVENLLDEDYENNRGLVYKVE